MELNEAIAKGFVQNGDVVSYNGKSGKAHISETHFYILGGDLTPDISLPLHVNHSAGTGEFRISVTTLQIVHTFEHKLGVQ